MNIPVIVYTASTVTNVLNFLSIFFARMNAYIY
jgi:hypothetical protein